MGDYYPAYWPRGEFRALLYVYSLDYIMFDSAINMRVMSCHENKRSCFFFYITVTVTCASWRLKPPAIRLFILQFVKVKSKETPNVRVIGPLWGESIGHSHYQSPCFPRSPSLSAESLRRRNDIPLFDLFPKKRTPSSSERSRIMTDPGGDPVTCGHFY